MSQEVEKILPELVFRDASGRPESVLYNELLLNEIQKHEKEIHELRALVQELRTEMRTRSCSTAP